MGSVETHSLYGGRHQLVFDNRNNQHLYHLKGRILPSATGVLGILNKPFLIPWAVKMAVDDLADRFVSNENLNIDEAITESKRASGRYSKIRRDIGTEAHAIIEDFINNDCDSLSYPGVVTEEAIDCAERFKQWEKDQGGIDWEFAERKVLSAMNMVCGTADMGFRHNGILYVGDIKTGKSVYAEAGVQLAAYKNFLAEELGGDWVGAGRAIFHIPVGGTGVKLLLEPEIEKLTGHNMKQDYNAFLSMLEVYRWKNSAKKKFIRKNN